MAVTGSARRRTALVASAVVVAVVTATSMAGAHESEDDGNSIHACVARNGFLRMLSDPAQDCRAKETALHWTSGAGDSSALAAFKADLLDASDTSALVDWSHLQNVPQWLQDGEVSLADLADLPPWLQDGAIDFGDLPGWLQDGAVTFEEITGGLPADSVTSATVDDGTLTAADLAGSYADGSAGAVTSEKIFDGTVEARDLANGAVTPEKVTANAQASQDPAVVPLDVERLLPAFPLPVDAPAGASILVTGQVQLRCTSCAGPLVRYELVRSDGTVVAGPYDMQLSTGHGSDVASISGLDVVTAAGSYAYRLRMSTIPSTADVEASNVVLVAHVLGT